MKEHWQTEKQDVASQKAESHKIRLGFVCLVRKAFDHAMARSMAEEARNRLLSVAGNLVVPQDWMIENLKQAAAAVKDFQTGHVDAVLVLCGTFASAELVLHIVERLGVPLIIWTVPEPDLGDYLHLNSLVGGNAITSALYKLGHPYRFYYHSVDDERFYEALGRYLRVLGLARAIRAARIGVLGGRPAGFQDIVFDELFLRRKIGFQLHTIELVDVIARSNRVSEEAAGDLSRKWQSEYSVAGPTSEELVTMGRLYDFQRERRRSPGHYRQPGVPPSLHDDLRGHYRRVEGPVRPHGYSGRDRRDGVTGETENGSWETASLEQA